MHTHPRNGLTAVIAFSDTRQTWALRLHAVVAVHARFGRRNRSMTRLIRRGVAVKAVHAEIAGMELVAVRDRLNRRIAGLKVRRLRHIQPQRRPRDHHQADKCGTDPDILISRFRENERHSVSSVLRSD